MVRGCYFFCGLEFVEGSIFVGNVLSRRGYGLGVLERVIAFFKSKIL